SFVGTLNVIEGEVTDASAGAIKIGETTVQLGRPLEGRMAGEAISLALRPEALSLGPTPGRDLALNGVIRDAHFLGSVIRVNVDAGGNLVSLDTFNKPSTPPPVAGQ